MKHVAARQSTRWLSAALMACGAASANAQTGSYPVNPVRIIVPYTAGGASDVVTRIIG